MPFNPEIPIGGGGSVPPLGRSLGGPQNLSTYAAQFTPQATNLFFNNLINWNGSPMSPRQHFLDVLEHWETSLPLQSLWMVFFHIPLVVQEASLKAWGEHHINMDWGVNQARGKLTDGKGNMYTGYGCALAQTVGIPVEQMSIDTTGPNNRGFLKGPVVQQRQAFAALNIEFLETNLSFNDFVLRPWIITASHQGLVARPNPAERITTDMFIVNMARAGTNLEWHQGRGDYVNTREFQPRKIWIFKDCIPVNIGQERYSYTTSSQVVRRDSEWNFRKYQVIVPPSFVDTMNAIDADQMNYAQQFWTGHKGKFKSKKKVGDLQQDATTESTNYWWESIEDGRPRSSASRTPDSRHELDQEDAKDYWKERTPKSPKPRADRTDAETYWNDRDELLADKVENIPLKDWNAVKGGRTPAGKRLKRAQGKAANDAATYWSQNDPHKKPRHSGNRR